MRLQFVSREVSGVDALDTGIRAVSVAEIDGAPLVFGSTGAGGGVSVYHLSQSGRLTLHDHAAFAPSLTTFLARDSVVVGPADGASLLLGGDAGGLISYALAADGSLDGPGAPLSVDPGLAPVNRMAFLPDANGGGLLSLAGEGVIAVDTAGGLTPLGGDAGAGLATALFQGTAGPVLLRATTGGAESLLAAEGTLTPMDAIGAAEGLGVASPTALETLAAHGTQFAILGAAGSASLSVLQVLPDGSLRYLDHLIDSRTSRFADLQDVAVARVADHVFVVAGGSDDGLSLFTLLPDGRLIHLDSLASTEGARLTGLTRLGATHAHDALHVFAATESDAGLAHLRVAMDGIGQVLSGAGAVDGSAGEDIVMGEGAAGTLSGGAGDDILVAGPSGATLTGGTGADLFVMQAGGGEVRITDFDRTEDRLDLSDYAMLRSPDQLEITAQTGGARIAFRDEVILIDSHDGAELDGDDLFGFAFDWPDRLTYFTESRVNTPDPPPDPAPVPDPDPSLDPEPSPDPDPSQTGGGIRTFRPHEADPWLVGADILFTPDDASADPIRLAADGAGRFDLSQVIGQSGHVQLARGHSADDPAFGVSDALDILRLAIGLEPSFGPADDASLIAADFDRDGSIGVDDALDVLRLAVGLDTETAPEWLFLDPGADLSAAASGTGPLPEGQALSVPQDGVWEFQMTTILLGDVDGLI